MRANDLRLPDWTLDTVPWDRVDRDAARRQGQLLDLVAAASFVEIASDLYTRNLASYAQGNESLTRWLATGWEHEEMRHGHVLRDYVLHVDPDFDWQAAYTAFFAEYSALCTLDEFEPTPGLEMAARCVVETGTATYYEALSLAAKEPVLAGITALIRADEVRHFKHFYRYFRDYQEREAHGRLRVLRVVLKRVIEARNSDAECALWHVFHTRHAGERRNGAAFREFCRASTRAVMRHYPIGMAIRMALKPVDLAPSVARRVEPALEWAARRVLTL